MLKARLLAGSRGTVNCVLSPETRRKTLDIQTPQTQVVNFSVVNLAHIAEGHLQKKDIRPVVVNCYQREVKYIKDVSCVAQLSFVKPVRNVRAVALGLPAGTRLQSFCKTWETLGVSLKVPNIL